MAKAIPASTNTSLSDMSKYSNSWFGEEGIHQQTEEDAIRQGASRSGVLNVRFDDAMPVEGSLTQNCALGSLCRGSNSHVELWLNDVLKPSGTGLGSEGGQASPAGSGAQASPPCAKHAEPVAPGATLQSSTGKGTGEDSNVSTMRDKQGGGTGIRHLASVIRRLSSERARARRRELRQNRYKLVGAYPHCYPWLLIC